jgi:hypothetical protein
MSTSPEKMLQSMLENLPAKTGRSLPEWQGVIADAGLSGHKEIMTFLKGTHGLTHGYANLVSQKVREAMAGGPPDGGDLVDDQYSGAKEPLRLIYEKLTTAVRAFGSDVEFSPKKTYVSLRRRKQFGLVQPSTKTRVDVGINLEDREPDGRLEASGSFNAMVSHRVRLSNPGEVDLELIAWLREAYEQAG